MAVETRSKRTLSQAVVRMQAAAAATGNGKAVDVSGMQKGAIEVDITGTGTVIFEGTINGVIWTAIRGLDLSAATETWVTSVAADKIIQFDVSGLLQIRARISAVSGSIEAWGHFQG